MDLALAAASLSADGKMLASRLFATTATSRMQNPDQLSPWPIRIPFTIRTPRKTRTIRVVVEAQPANRIGSADLNRQTLDAAPAQPAAQPQLAPTRSTPSAP